jgi:hypothetical protein
MHHAIDYTPADRNRIPTDVEHLLVHPLVISDQMATVKSIVDRVFNCLTGRLLAAVLSNKRFKIVPWFAENMAAPVRIIHAAQAEISPWADRGRARR